MINKGGIMEITNILKAIKALKLECINTDIVEVEVKDLEAFAYYISQLESEISTIQKENSILQDTCNKLSWRVDVLSTYKNKRLIDFIA